MRNETAKKKEIEKGVLLDPDRKSPRAKEFEDKLSAQIVGQERAVRRMSGLFQIYLAGMNNPSRPIGTMLFLGPTGSGKTRVVEAASDVLFTGTAFGRQDRLRRIPAFARDRQADRIASGISRPSRNIADADAGKSRQGAYRRHQADLRAFRRDREGVGFAVAAAAGHPGQGHSDAGRQSPRRFFENGRHYDVESRRARNVRYDLGRHRICADQNRQGAGRQRDRRQDLSHRARSRET